MGGVPWIEVQEHRVRVDDSDDPVIPGQRGEGDLPGECPPGLLEVEHHVALPGGTRIGADPRLLLGRKRDDLDRVLVAACDKKAEQREEDRDTHGAETTPCEMV